VSSMTEAPLLQARGLSKHFPLERGLLAHLRGAKSAIKAVESVSLDVYAGRTLAIVGESGSGKSTLGRLLLRLLRPSAGQVLYRGENMFAMKRARLRAFRRQAQIILQDPFASLNPRMLAGTMVAEPLVIHGLAESRAERRDRVAALFEQAEQFRRIGRHSAQRPSSGGQALQVACSLPSTQQ